jgi:hypothetical protein
MGPLVSILSWLFFHTIYGLVAVAALLYVALRELRKRFPRVPNPTFVVGPVALIGLFVLPSIPRYLFEKRTLAQIEGKGWMRVVHTTKWGDILEPLTWVNAPIGSFTIIMPEPPVEGAFRQMIIRYEKEPIIRTVEADCSQSTIHYAEPDKDGIFRYTTPYSVEMSALQKRWYCEYDWTREEEAFRTEYLRQAGDRSKKP